MIIDADAIGFPGALSMLPEGEYTVQAVIDLNLGGRSIGESPGNLYSLPQRLKFSGAHDRKINIDFIRPGKPMENGFTCRTAFQNAAGV